MGQITVDAITFIKPNHLADGYSAAFSRLFCSPTAIDPPDVAKFILVTNAGTEILHCYWASVPRSDTQGDIVHVM